MSTLIAPPYSTNEAAKIVERDPSRIRQLCIAHKIGRKFGRDWLLEEKDLERIRALLRPEKNSD